MSNTRVTLRSFAMTSTNYGSSSKRSSSTAVAAEDLLRQQLADLQLPHMPPATTASVSSSPDPPTLRILVVADVDLASASALAESALSSSSSSTNSATIDEKNPLHRVDLCIACGPFCREEDLRGYYRGRQRKRHLTKYSNLHHSSPSSPYLQHNSHPSLSSSSTYGRHRHNNHHNQGKVTTRRNNNNKNNGFSYPYKRTQEETAALEGLMTATLSQLESIVCRVVFVPGHTDPITTITTSSSSSCSYRKERRLTPNSRNIHQHWMPLSPGLGCAGLLYLDCQKLQQPSPLDDDDDDEGEDYSESSDSDVGADPIPSLQLPGNKEAWKSRKTTLQRSALQATERSKEYGYVVWAPKGCISSVSCSGDTQTALVFFNSFSPLAFPEWFFSSPFVSLYLYCFCRTKFCSSLTKLVESAPPTSAVTQIPTSRQSITALLQTSLFQSIVVTQFHHLEDDDNDDDDDGGDDDYYPNDNKVDYYRDETDSQHSIERVQEGETNGCIKEEDEEFFDPPWPLEHETFCALPVVQEHVLLEIAAGRNSTGATVKPKQVPKGNMKIVFPGSLRERGEFCLIDVAFMQDPYNHHSKDYRWRVRRTRFQTIQDFL